MLASMVRSGGKFACSLIVYSFRLCLCAMVAVLLLPISSESRASTDVWRATEGWYTLHHDVMRTGRTQYSPGAPFDYVWRREYFDEVISPEVEPIVAEGSVYVGTLKGVVHALNADTGVERWSVQLNGPIHHSPAYAEGVVVTATMARQGEVVGLNARTGAIAWRFNTLPTGGFAASPAIYGGTVYIGDRSGKFYGLDLHTGNLTLIKDIGAPILQTCAIKDGRIALCGEDMVPRLLSTRYGTELWHGAQMDGATARGYYPVFWRDLVVWRTESYGIDAYQTDIEQATEDGRRWAETRRTLGWTPQAEQIIAQLPDAYTDAKYAMEQNYVLRQMQTGKHPRSFYAYSVSDGKERRIYAVGYHGSENGYSVPPSPPVDQNDTLYVFTKSVYSRWTFPIRPFDALSTLDYDTGLPHLIRNVNRINGSFPATCDEVNNLTIGGDKLYDTHDHLLTYMNMRTHEVFNAYSSHAPELWGGVYKAIARDDVPPTKPNTWRLADPTNSLHLSTQWNGPTQGAIAIYRDKVWWITGSMVICLKGTVKP